MQPAAPQLHHHPAEPPGPSSWNHVARSDDVDEFAELQRNWSLRCEQLSQGTFDGELQHVQLPGVRVVRERSSRAMRQQGQLGPKNHGMAMGEGAHAPAYFHGMRLGPSTLMIGGVDDVDLLTPENYVQLGLVVDADLLSALWLQLFHKPWSVWLDQKVTVPARPSVVPLLQAHHLGLLNAVALDPVMLQNPDVVRHMRDGILLDWIEAIPARVELADLKAVKARQRVVSRACERVEQTAHEVPTLLQVCADIGVSPRKLDYCFQDVLGLSPARYFRAMRLNAVRRALKQAGADASVSVQDIAARWGFWHMGAFGQDYRLQFGELPSETRRRHAC